MRLYADADTAGAVILTSVFVVSLLTVAAYTRWHFWWKTGWGRTRMLLLLSLAGVTLDPATRSWSGIPEDSTGDHIIRSVGLLAEAGVLLALLYMLARIITANVRRMRYPEESAERSRKYLQRTPGATQEEVEKLIACWDETHSRRQWLP